MATLVGIVVLAALADFFVRATDRGLRIMLSATLVAGLVASWWQLLSWWRRQRWSESAAAQVLQRTFPQLGDRLASALEFLRQEEDDVTAGSALLRRAVVAEATASLDELPAEQVAERPSLRRAAVAAVAAVGMAVVLSALSPHATRTAIARLAAPWNNVEWPRRHDLAFVDAPKLIGRGDPFEVSLVDTSGNLPEEVAIEYRYQLDGETRIEQSLMQRVGNTMVARRENVRRPFAFRATGGDHNTMAWRHVEVADRPTASNVELTVVPPAYSGLPKVTATSNTRVVSGSTIEVSATASQPLSTAQLLLGEDAVLALATSNTSIATPSEQWQPTSDAASKTLNPRLRLLAKSGLESIVNLPRVEVVADTPPQLTWASPDDELFVVSDARVPVAVLAADNLAIATARLTVSASDAPVENRSLLDVELYLGEASPPSRDALPQSGESVDERRLTYELDLAALRLSPGTTVELLATATDYRPQTGTVDAPRRLTVITTAELDSRLAADQADILRLLEQALADQRVARDAASRIAVASDDGNAASREHLDLLVAARLTQQGVRRTLLGQAGGVLERSQAVLDRMAVNRLEHPDLVAQLDRVCDTIDALGSGPLPAAEQSLTELRKAFETRLGRENGADQSQQFGLLDDHQQAVVTALESLIDEAAAWSDSDRFVRELARLEQEQRELRDEVLAATRQRILAASDPSFRSTEEENLKRLAAAQADLARRFDKLAQSMRNVAGSETAISEIAARLADALAAAESVNLSAQLAGASRELGDDQLGRAAETQLSAADTLGELVNLLRERAPKDPAEIASRLRQVQQQLAELKQQAADAERQADAGLQQQERRDLEEQLARVARQLSRLTAQAASRSAQSASSSAAPTAGESRPQAKENLQQAQREIEQAERELAQRLAELDGEQQQRLLDRLAQVLEALIPRQQDTLQETLALELLLETPGVFEDGGQARANDLSATERRIAEELSEAIADVERRPVFQLALGGAADDMRQAARGLEQLQVGRVTQSLELNALSRMRHVLDILRQPAPPPPEGDTPPASEGGDGAGGAPQPPPLIELAEVKMLRWLQSDLNNRTRLWEADYSDNASVAAEKREAARRLAAEQQELEELVRAMMRRNNDNAVPPVDL